MMGCSFLDACAQWSCAALWCARTSQVKSAPGGPRLSNGYSFVRRPLCPAAALSLQVSNTEVLPGFVWMARWPALAELADGESVAALAAHAAPWPGGAHAAPRPGAPSPRSTSPGAPSTS